MKTGAIVLAAGLSSRMGWFKPLLKIGPLTAAQHIITNFQLAGVEPIVFVTGNQADLLESHLSDTGVICLRNEEYAVTQMLDSAKIGLRYLKTQCDRILLTPVDIPLFSCETVQRLMESGAPLAAPIYQGKKGHPLLLSQKLIPFLETYDGPGGLGEALKKSTCAIFPVEVDDDSILTDMDTKEDYSKMLLKYQVHRNKQGAP